VRMALQWLCSYVHGWLHVCFWHGFFTSLQQYKHTWQHVSKKKAFTNSWWPQWTSWLMLSKQQGKWAWTWSLCHHIHFIWLVSEEHCWEKGCTPCDNLGWTFDQLLCCSILWLNASYMLPQHEDHNGERKAKRARIDNSDSHLIELPWVYKPMLCSLLVLWVLSSWNFAKVFAHKWEGHSMWWRWPLWSSSKCSSPSP
jgi:hypothetical protein